jgi:hypothetical protein
MGSAWGSRKPLKVIELWKTIIKIFILSSS